MKTLQTFYGAARTVHGEFEISQKFAAELRKQGVEAMIPDWKQKVSVQSSV